MSGWNFDANFGHFTVVRIISGISCAEISD
jgi:hypothetical protein